MKPNSAESLRAQAAQSVQGFALGSKILTLDGELPVEFLSAGDRVITRDSGMAILTSVRARRVRCEMIEVMGGTLGHERPDCDTLLPAHQKVLVRDWRAEALRGKAQALVAASELVDGEFIRAVGAQLVTLYELTFEAPHILYVDGMELACDSAEAQQRAA